MRTVFGVRELARVVRPGGRFVGIYNRDRHMEELWSRVRPEAGLGDDCDDVLGLLGSDSLED